MKVLKTPWKKELLALTNGSKQSIKVTSPFVKQNICSELLDAKRPSTKFELITSFKLMSIYSGGLDLKAIDAIISKHGIVKNYPKLHSKIYLFDEDVAIVTSSNLTHGGLIGNFEYGVLVDDHRLVSEIAEDYNSISNHENTGRVKHSDVETVKNMLKKIVKASPIKLPTFEFEPVQESDVIEIDVDPIKNSLSGWKLDVFNYVNEIRTATFSLSDVYQFESSLRRKYSNNKHIRDKIRQQLQNLRDLGLIEFLGSGRYRKLWKQTHFSNKN
ncbi:MAG: NgoFVII family restriction endonuclease [Ignavibacteriales bacterium]|nr:NgoFVII family restriction endonuclease [Ignavibacteriales bacterium]